MESEIEWIRQALQQSKGKTQAGIAKALNLDRSSVSRLIKGERRLKYTEAQRIADYLEISPPRGLSEDPTDFEHNHSQAQRVEILKARSQGSGYWLLDSNSIVGTRSRTDTLDGAPLAFGLFVPDDAMVPRFKIGELLWINPAVPAAPGDDALMVPTDCNDDTRKVFACEIEHVSEREAHTIQYGRNTRTTFDLSRWHAQQIIPRR